ncbi:uncharacterized protein LOC120631731 [Pararge aegeria]|uniref:uncharacterized protein LOC120631731 n=1 Tax=Pararge aegeria TaxID=116150 RepID=UPI0019D2B947|nr:uncharacterized protein LOC120631731 [Pararge aegeria]
MERNIIVCADLRPLDQDELAFRRRALRDAVICIGWLKLISVLCYMILYFLVVVNSKESNMSKAIQFMILAIIPLIILNGLLLFLGALEERIWALEIGLWLCIAIASYNTVLGVMGGIHFIRTGHLTMHFMLAIVFALLAISLFTVVCHDVLLIHAYKKHLRSSVT